MPKPIYVAIGWCAVALGMIGAVLPLLPTVPFMILAAACFAKGSPAARDWLLGHAVFGDHIRRWEATGGISRRGKAWAAGSMLAVFTLSLILRLPWSVLAIQAVCLTGAALFVLSRPDERSDRA